MANTYGVYNPIFYANEALIQLENSLGLAQRVYRAYEDEWRSFGKGETINIRRPGTFTAQNAPASTAQDIVTETVSATLSNHKEVKFKVPDKEYYFTGRRLVDDHIRPAAVAIAEAVDSTLQAQIATIPWYVDSTTALTVAKIVEAKKVLFDNKAPRDNNIHAMLNGSGEADLLQLSAFAQWQGAGPTGEQTQLSGFLGSRYGAEFFATQTVGTLTSGANGRDKTMSINDAATTVGQTSVAVDGGTASEVYKAGETFTIAGDTQRYVLTADATMTTGAGTFNFAPGFKIAPADNAVITHQADFSTDDASFDINAMFHRNAIGLAMAPLPDYEELVDGNQGAQIATVTDPLSGLSIRARVYMMHDLGELRVTLDALWATVTLDHNLGVRMLRRTA